MRVLEQDFFARPVVKVAPDLLGKMLVRRRGNRILRALITEVEAYDGPNDLACHGRFGVTERTKVMFGPAGYFYVYFCYGMHWMLNIVTGEEGYPSAVLIRGAVTDKKEGRGAWSSAPPQILNGPGRLTRALSINRSLNGKPVEKSSGLWIEKGTEIDSE